MANQRHGFLVVEYGGSGDRYEGEWVLGKKEGKGRYTSHNGDIYEGEYREGKRNGVGLYKYSNGDEYEGQWLRGKKHGQGRMSFVNGAIYEGGYKEDKKHHKGIYRHADGSCYTGEYKEGKPSGRGVYIFPTGERFEGEFVGGFKHGKGTVTLTDGMKYSAKYHLGKRATRKKIIALPSGFNEQDDDMLPTPSTGPAAKAAKGHEKMFSFANNDDLKLKQAPGKVSDFESMASRDSHRKFGLTDKKFGMQSADFDKSRGSEKSFKFGELDSAFFSSDLKGAKKQQDVERSDRRGSQTSHLVITHGRGTLDAAAAAQSQMSSSHSHKALDADALELFKVMDTDGNGYLSWREISLALSTFGFSTSKIERVFEAADINQDGQISIAEFSEGIVPILVETEQIKNEIRSRGEFKATEYLDFTIHQCRNLPDLSSNVIDHTLTYCPFVQLQYGGKAYQTRAAKGSLNPVFEQTFRVFLNNVADESEFLLSVMEWEVTTNQSSLVGSAKVLWRDIHNRSSSEFHETLQLRRPDGRPLMFQDLPSVLEISIGGESLPILLRIDVGTGENLSLDDQNLPDPFVRVTVAGQLYDSKVIKSSSRPEFHETISFNLFSEDLLKPLTLEVLDWSSSRAKGGGFLGMVQFHLHKLLLSNSSANGWFPLVDRDFNPIAHNDQLPARLWLRVRCILRSEMHDGESEFGLSTRPSSSGTPAQRSFIDPNDIDEDEDTEEEQWGLAQEEEEEGEEENLMQFLGIDEGRAKAGRREEKPRPVPSRSARKPSAGSHSSSNTGGGSSGGKVLTESEELQVARLQKKMEKAAGKGDVAVAEQYRKDIMRLQGLDYMSSQEVSAGMQSSSIEASEEAFSRGEMEEMEEEEGLGSYDALNQGMRRDSSKLASSSLGIASGSYSGSLRSQESQLTQDEEDEEEEEEEEVREEKSKKSIFARMNPFKKR